MQPVRNRQPRALASAIFFAALALAAAGAVAAPEVAEELRAAGAQAAALARVSAEPAEWKKVEAAYADLAARHPRDPAVRRSFADFLWERNEPARAMREWEAAEELEPKNAALLERLAKANLAVGNTKSSAQYWEKVCAAQPERARYRHAAGQALFLFRHELVNADRNEQRVIETALAHLAAATRLAPLDAEYARAYAETFYAVPKPDWAAALAAWERYLEISPNKDFAHSNLARVHLRMGRHDDAKHALEMIQGSDFARLKANLRKQIEAGAGAPAVR